MSKRKKVILIIISILVATLLYVILASKVFNNFPLSINLKHKSGEFGATFSKKYCEELDLNWQEAYLSILDDLKVRYLRLPAYWDEIEKEQGIYNFDDFDYMVNQASSRDANLIINLGRRQPRWPECHSPSWLNKESDEVARASLLKLIETTVLRYKDNPQVINWQVENEAFLGTFGVCPPLDKDLLQAEVDLVRSLDSRPIIITGSGEMSLWHNERKMGDVLGVTMYRVVYNSWAGYIRYFFPTSFYTLKTYLAGANPAEVINMELQMEPWVPKGKMIHLTEAQIDKSMSVDQFRANAQYAINAGFKQTYVWGIEWWYWQKLYGNLDYWNIGKSLFN